MEDERLVQAQPRAVALAHGGVQPHDVLAAGRDVVRLGAERAAGGLSDLAEVGERRIPPALLAGEAVAAGGVPDCVLGEDARQPLQVAAVEVFVAPANRRHVLLDAGHRSISFAPLPLWRSAQHTRAGAPRFTAAGRRAEGVPGVN